MSQWLLCRSGQLVSRGQAGETRCCGSSQVPPQKPSLDFATSSSHSNTRMMMLRQCLSHIMSLRSRLQPKSSDIMTFPRLWACSVNIILAGLHPGVLLRYGSRVQLKFVQGIMSARSYCSLSHGDDRLLQPNDIGM